MSAIDLGTEEDLLGLYSYPNIAGDYSASLEATILHWLRQSLARDMAKGCDPRIVRQGFRYFLEISGPPCAEEIREAYARRLPAYLENGYQALRSIVPKIRAEGKWNPDPSKDGDEWRFFLPHGMPMARQKSLQFFHYPPIRLLDPMRDYLHDPVPVRCEELLRANGVARGEEALYECVMDATPIAAPDDQGSKKSAQGDPEWGLIPIQNFPDYQKSQVRLLLNDAASGYTIPIVVYGSHPRDIFSNLFPADDKLKVNTASTARILKGKKTPVIGANHPYRFYATAQGGNNVGSGKIDEDVDRDLLMELMITDLATARWQVVMADNASLDPKKVIIDCTAFWDDSAQQELVSDLIEHQGSLYYPDPTGLQFEFLVPSPV